MTDPYEILNVPSSASDSEVKAAYRELVKKYHPDNYRDNPLADLAQEKLKEINEAYEEIQRQRSGNGGTGQRREPARPRWRGAGAGGGRYPGVREAISRGDLARAETELSRVSTQDAEWHFLMGAVAYRKGWYDEAARYFSTAHSLDPSNPEYAQAVQTMQSGVSWGGVQNDEACNCCTSMICANCLCNCLGDGCC